MSRTGSTRTTYPALDGMPRRNQIMYMEYKGDDIVGPARIGRVTFTKTGKSVDYKGRRFTTLRGRGFNREHYWISGRKKEGTDALSTTIVEIDEDVREEYWMLIRNKPEKKTITSFKSVGKYSK